jgi:SAM-dependent methyltransferase
VDVSRAAIELSKARNPGAIHAVMDVRDLDCLAGQFDLVIANLSLHYFKRESTVAVFKSVYRLVKADGVFAFRVNAFDDVESGAPSVLPGWECVSVGGIVKQFFTREKIEKVLGGRWRILSEEKLRVWRYNRWKSIFEVIARKNSD